MTESLKIAAPCGLYCGVCSTFLERVCHGCGCGLKDCFAERKHEVCTIYQCVQKKKIGDCSQCDNFPCTDLIQFAYDPIMRTHLPVLENLARRRKIGVEAWTGEQAKYWEENPAMFDEWIAFHQECKRKRKRLSEKVRKKREHGNTIR